VDGLDGRRHPPVLRQQLRLQLADPRLHPAKSCPVT
jgi:hypothetical protein